MTDGPHHLFVYGTLRSGCHHAMHEVIATNATFVGDATVCAALYDLGSYPGIVLSDDPSKRVTGELYAVNAGALGGMIDALDEYEGIGPTAPLPHEYTRQVVTATRGDGSHVEAWTYVLSGLKPEYVLIPGGDYLGPRSQKVDNER